MTTKVIDTARAKATAPEVIERHYSQDWKLGNNFPESGQSYVFQLQPLRSGVPKAVIKIFNRNSETDIERQQREMQVLLSMNHPNIVKLLGYEIERQPFWYITPHGESLWSYWKNYRVKNEPDLWFNRGYQIICDILDGLAACHSQGLIHRDIKPQNIIIQENGSASIIDFGIVYIPEAERITTRWAGNRLVKYPPALYKTDAVVAEWDCLSVAAVWGWMLAADEELAYGHYHSPFA
jgi:serine/threonine protein kinase